MINIKPTSVTNYVMHQVKVQKEREGRKKESEVARQKQTMQNGLSFGNMLQEMTKKMNKKAQDALNVVIDKRKNSSEAGEGQA